MYKLNRIKITDMNVDIQCEDKELNKEWGICFIASNDNSENLAKVKEYCTNKEFISITKQVDAIEIHEVEIDPQAIYNQAIKDLAVADTNLIYITEQSTRAVGTLLDWYAYKEALRDIASLKDGVYSIYDISEKTYLYNGIDYTRPLDETGYPIKPTKLILK